MRPVLAFRTAVLIVGLRWASLLGEAWPSAAAQAPDPHQAEIVRAEAEVAKRTAEFGPDHLLTLNSMSDLADAYQAKGRWDQAVAVLQQILERRRAALGPDHSLTLASTDALARAFQASGQPAKAVPLAEQICEYCKRKRGVDDVGTVNSMVNLGIVYLDAGVPDKATPVLELALEKSRKLLGPEHPETLNDLRHLAAAYEGSGQGERAVPLRRQFLDFCRARGGPDHPSALTGMHELAGAYLAARQPIEAEKLARECLQLRTRLEPDAWTTSATQALLGRVLVAQKRHADAEPLLVQGCEAMTARAASLPTFGKQCLAEAVRSLMRLYEETGRPERAAPWGQKLTTKPTTAR
jgi:tetratricopeptide (TPR) repeat protein